MSRVVGFFPSDFPLLCCYFSSRWFCFPCCDTRAFFYTESETKLLYWVMLRLRMSAHGPRTRSKRALSSLTHLRGPRATTVAALGLSSSRAISPASIQDDMSGRNERTYVYYIFTRFFIFCKSWLFYFISNFLCRSAKLLWVQNQFSALKYLSTL